ncbi:MAG TPA: hypothetical protein GX530_10100 [Corynebacteriales bacterium]|jgi:hypothetical protein|nr:hypothetical protein [Mycobacteriales bacterium]
MADRNIVIRKRNTANTGWENLYPVTSASNVITGDGVSVENFLNENAQDLTDHKEDTINPHRYEDVGTDPDFIGVKYRLVVINGKTFMEVVEA